MAFKGKAKTMRVEELALAARGQHQSDLDNGVLKMPNSNSNSAYENRPSSVIGGDDNALSIRPSFDAEVLRERLQIAWVAVTIIFLLVPLAVVIAMSFSSGQFLTMPNNFSLRWYETVLASEQWRIAAKNSLVIGLLAVSIALPAGLGLALANHYAPRGWKSLVRSSAMGPMVVPVIVFAIALFFLLAKLGLIGTAIGVAIGHALLVMPFIFMSVSTALEYFDDQLIEAAESLGASRIYAWRTVMLPFVAPAIAVGTALAFVNSLDEAVVAIFVGRGDTLTIPSLMWRSINLEITPGIAAVASMVTGAGIVIQGAAFFWLWRHWRTRIR
ncbi:ABC transporter permease [Sinorhizobium fredii]|uniref:ABC transporter permease n=1 Tax=Rhizobium fredii TaxID=380 RepID=UPI001F0A35FC|nr:ABC transporter permease [Sinorhizobium fredii]